MRPAVVCLHSSGSSSSQWKPLFEAEPGRHLWVGFDLYGHGRRGRYTGDRYAVSAESAAVAQLVDAIDAPVHLVGHSYGGAVALDFAARHPHRVLSVSVYEPVLFALLDPGSDEHRSIASVGRAIVALVASGEADAAAARFVDYWNGKGTWFRMGTELRARIRARMEPVAAHFEALFADPVPLVRLRALRAPVLVMAGDRSPAPARAICDRLALLPAVRRITLPGGGHMAPVTHAGIVNAAILEHLFTFDAAARVQYAA